METCRVSRRESLWLLETPATPRTTFRTDDDGFSRPCRGLGVSPSLNKRDEKVVTRLHRCDGLLDDTCDS